MSAADQTAAQGYQRRSTCSQLVTLASRSGRVLDRRRSDRHRAIRGKGHLAEPQIAPRHLGSYTVGRPGVVKHPHLAGLSDQSTMSWTGSDIVGGEDRFWGLGERAERAIGDRMPDCVLRRVEAVGRVEQAKPFVLLPDEGRLHQGAFPGQVLLEQALWLAVLARCGVNIAGPARTAGPSFSHKREVAPGAGLKLPGPVDPPAFGWQT